MHVALLLLLVFFFERLFDSRPVDEVSHPNLHYPRRRNVSVAFIFRSGKTRRVSEEPVDGSVFLLVQAVSTRLASLGNGADRRSIYIEGTRAVFHP